MNKKNKSMSVQFEIRAVDEEQGIFEGYASVFGVVDTYGTSIQRGAFAKTLQERADKIKVLFNHDEDEPIGKPLEMREDHHGLWVRAQLVRGVQKAEETLLLMKSGVINTLSIGFSVPRGKDTVVDGVRQINEVKLFEFSPVVFESNSSATIANVRAQDFQTTIADELLENGHWRLMDSLYETLMDVWWAGDGRNAGDVERLLGKACDDFAEAYKTWAAEYTPLVFPESQENIESRAALPSGNGLSKVVLDHIRSNKLSIEKLAMNTTLTIEEARQAARGKLQSSKMLTEFGDTVASEYRKHRRGKFEQLAEHLRDDLNAAERSQLSALLNIQPQSTGEARAAEPREPQQALTQLMDEIHSFNKQAKEI